MSKLGQYLKQNQRLSPQQIQLMKLLQVPTALLEERISIEIQENPALENNAEENEKSLDEKTEDEIERETAEEINEYEEISNDNYEIDVSNYLKDDDEGYGNLNSFYSNDDDEDNMPSNQFKIEESFHDNLYKQVALINISENKRKVADFLIGSLDDDGYLRRDIQSLIDDLAFRQNIVIDKPSLLEVINAVQQIDPAGIAARDLQECLLIQLRRKPQNIIIKKAIEIFEHHFEAFTKKHYDKISKALQIDDEELKIIIQEIVHLNPRPGQEFTPRNEVQSFMIPDFYVVNDNGELQVELNSKNAPELKISNNYKSMLKEYSESDKKNSEQREAVVFIKQKIDSARWFIDAVKQRQQTLFLTMQSICRIQEEFFLTGDETQLRPMILKDISDRTSLDISTVSRVVNSKFVQTEFGTYKLKYFFSESLTKDDGEEVSTREVKTILTEEIEKENKQKPLSDDKLTQILQEKGYNVARRTIAKYREQLNIPVARLRKEL